MERRDPFEDAEVEAARAEAASIGGVAGDEDLDPADRPVREAGGGEQEGFEQAEEALIEHASHGDQHSARMPLYDVGRDEEAGVTAQYGEADGLTSASAEEGVEQARSVDADEPSGPLADPPA